MVAIKRTIVILTILLAVLATAVTAVSQTATLTYHDREFVHTTPVGREIVIEIVDFGSDYVKLEVDDEIFIRLSEGDREIVDLGADEAEELYFVSYFYDTVNTEHYAKIRVSSVGTEDVIEFREGQSVEFEGHTVLFKESIGNAGLQVRTAIFSVDGTEQRVQEGQNVVVNTVCLRLDSVYNNPMYNDKAIAQLLDCPEEEPEAGPQFDEVVIATAGIPITVQGTPIELLTASSRSHEAVFNIGSACLQKAIGENYDLPCPGAGVTLHLTSTKGSPNSKAGQKAVFVVRENKDITHVRIERETQEITAPRAPVQKARPAVINEEGRVQQQAPPTAEEIVPTDAKRKRQGFFARILGFLFGV